MMMTTTKTATMTGEILVHVTAVLSIFMLTCLAQTVTVQGMLTDNTIGCHMDRFPCYEDCCRRVGWFCHQREQRCVNCDTRKELCGTDSLPFECQLYCYLLQQDIDAEKMFCFPKETAIPVGTVVGVLELLLLAICAYALYDFFRRRKSNEQPTMFNLEEQENGGFSKTDNPTSTASYRSSLGSETSSDTVDELVDTTVGQADELTKPLIPWGPPEGAAIPDDPACPGAVTPEGRDAARTSGVQLEQPSGGTVSPNSPPADHGETARFQPNEGGGDVSGNSEKPSFSLSAMNPTSDNDPSGVLALDTANPVPGLGQNRPR